MMCREPTLNKFDDLEEDWANLKGDCREQVEGSCAPPNGSRAVDGSHPFKNWTARWPLTGCALSTGRAAISTGHAPVLSLEFDQIFTQRSWCMLSLSHQHFICIMRPRGGKMSFYNFLLKKIDAKTHFVRFIFDTLKRWLFGFLLFWNWLFKWFFLVLFCR